MRRTRFDDWPCPIARTTDLIGDWWTPLVMREAFFGRRRFDEFQSALDAPRAVLTARLNRLCDEGMLERVAYQDHPPRHEYRLTDKGLALHPVIMAIVHWGDVHYAGPAGPPLLHRHKACGCDFAPVTTCSECGEPVTARDVEVRAG